jgi:uncharacterized protein HemY
VIANPEDPAVYAMLGRFYARNDQYVRAIHFLERALALDTDHEEARAMLGTLEDLLAADGE